MHWRLHLLGLNQPVHLLLYFPRRNDPDALAELDHADKIAVIDIAVLAKAAAASIDDVGAAAGRASAKAAGVIVDDTAVTPRYVQGLDPKLELPIIKKIAIGSLRNKLLFILPVDRIGGISEAKIREVLSV